MRSRFFISAVLLTALSFVFGSCLDTNNVSYFQQIQEDVAEIDAFLESHPPTDPADLVLKDNYSGIRLVVTEPGTGAIPPSPQNVIEVSYRGKRLVNGDTVDADGDPYLFDQSDSFVFTLDAEDGTGTDVITGWKFALTMMTEGTKATVFIPSGLAYGTRGSGTIPKNAILVFDLELRTVLTSDQEPRFTTDKSAISAALEAVPNVVEDPSGISYILEVGPGGLTPSLYDQVRFRYTVKKLDGTTVLKETVEEGPRVDFSSFLVNHPHGVILAMQKMNEGDKAKVYTPSVLAYGVKGFGAIPANTPVIFEVELLQVTPYQQ